MSQSTTWQSLRAGSGFSTTDAAATPKKGRGGDRVSLFARRKQDRFLPSISTFFAPAADAYARVPAVVAARKKAKAAQSKRDVVQEREANAQQLLCDTMDNLASTQDKLDALSAAFIYMPSPSDQ